MILLWPRGMSSQWSHSDLAVSYSKLHYGLTLRLATPLDHCFWVCKFTGVVCIKNLSEKEALAAILISIFFLS